LEPMWPWAMVAVVQHRRLPENMAAALPIEASREKRMNAWADNSENMGKEKPNTKLSQKKRVFSKAKRTRSRPLMTKIILAQRLRQETMPKYFFRRDYARSPVQFSG